MVNPFGAKTGVRTLWAAMPWLDLRTGLQINSSTARAKSRIARWRIIPVTLSSITSGMPPDARRDAGAIETHRFQNSEAKAFRVRCEHGHIGDLQIFFDVVHLFAHDDAVRDIQAVSLPSSNGAKCRRPRMSSLKASAGGSWRWFRAIGRFALAGEGSRNGTAQLHSLNPSSAALLPGFGAASRRVEVVDHFHGPSESEHASAVSGEICRNSRDRIGTFERMENSRSITGSSQVESCRCRAAS